MPDQLDRASQLEEEDRERSLNTQRNRSDFDKLSLKNCEDCDWPIPQARQAFGGVTRCVECQAFFEETGG
ncbi:TraR/DksA C4-type zinc finger protein [uncultured Microbulbifer sp.]|uniref:TraR/DksA C4-type zinc finger protein n=1 Tax=uncultured Microbulbifer sp. TaxID=348147 RepID=UPI00263005FF|nr:TraR/DksA C4-type zinc finger protein [uncultured Microbulbifer sp.]